MTVKLPVVIHYHRVSHYRSFMLAVIVNAAIQCALFGWVWDSLVLKYCNAFNEENEMTFFYDFL